jgi:hypothetical protein
MFCGGETSASVFPGSSVFKLQMNLGRIENGRPSVDWTLRQSRSLQKQWVCSADEVERLRGPLPLRQSTALSFRNSGRMMAGQNGARPAATTLSRCTYRSEVFNTAAEASAETKAGA